MAYQRVFSLLLHERHHALLLIHQNTHACQHKNTFSALRRQGTAKTQNKEKTFMATQTTTTKLLLFHKTCLLFMMAQGPWSTKMTEVISTSGCRDGKYRDIFENMGYF